MHSSKIFKEAAMLQNGKTLENTEMKLKHAEHIKSLQTKISLENSLSFLSLVEFEIMVTPKAVRN